MSPNYYEYSIEYFLLNADAICKTANKTDRDIREKVKYEINAVLEKGKVDKLVVSDGRNPVFIAPRRQQNNS